MLGWPRKTSTAIVSFALIMAALRFVPSFEQFHVLQLATLLSIFDFPGRSAVVEASATNSAVGQLIDPAGSLEAFYRAVQRVEDREPASVVQVLHFGDSPIAADQISSDVRKLLQDRLGSAGEGFVLIAKPWPWYNHRGVDISAEGWRIHAASQDFEADGLHGLGGASFEGSAGAAARYRYSQPHRRAEILYWAQPGGGSLDILAAGTTLARISTASQTPESGYRAVELPPEAREVRLRVASGQVRLFGISFETYGPGFRYHSLGLNAAQIETVLRHFEPVHWAAQIRHQRPDLIVINYGANESGYPSYVEGSYAEDLRQLVRRVQAAAPESSILIMSPMDRGVRNGRGEIVTMPKLAKLVEIQRQVAIELGCAFFNTFQAMGGEGTMGRWYAARPRLASADYMHPLPAGARQVGALAESALWQGYLRSRRSRAPLSEK